MKLIRYVLMPLRPAKSAPELVHDQHKLSYAIVELVILGALYTITVFVGYLNGFGAVVKPFLAIAPKDYYLWETFFCIPVFLLIAIIFAGTARLIAASLGGTGTFEDLFAIYGSSLVLPTLLTMWLPESLLMIGFPQARSTPLGGFQAWPSWIDDIRQVVGVLWPIGITSYAMGYVEQMSLPRRIITSVLAFVPAAALMLVFIR